MKNGDSPPLDPDDIPDDLFSPNWKYRKSDPRTSKWAALQNAPRAGSQRAELLSIHLANPQGLTNYEVSSFTSMCYDSLTTRISELHQGGWLADTGTERPSQYGVSQIVWSITPKTIAHYPDYFSDLTE